MREVGSVQKLFMATIQDGYNEVTKLELDSGGMIGSKHHNNDSMRSVLLSSFRSYEIAKKEGIEIPYGTLGENILVDYSDLYLLKPYDKIQIGEVLFEVTQNCTMCRGLSSVNAKLPKLLKDDRGIFAKVIQSGTLTISDKVYL